MLNCQLENEEKVNNLDHVPARRALKIHNPGYLKDHLFQGKPVLPAVEAMEALAGQAKQIAPQSSVTTLADARFDKFLGVDPNQNEIAAFAEFEVTATGSLNASLITRTTSPKLGITRTKIHAVAVFSQTQATEGSVPMDVAAIPEGVLTSVSSRDIYRELVPFGPAYRNIAGSIWLSPDGALAPIKCPPWETKEYQLGSPFTLDAAFHAACVWSQKYKNVVAFPVGIDRRQVFGPTRAGQFYWGRILPRKTSSDLLVFDIWLLDEAGRVCEIAQGVQMRDVSGGRLKPPAWIVYKDAKDPLENLSGCCKGLCVIELDALPPLAQGALSSLEFKRFKTLGDRRKKSYLAARLALKRLFRTWYEEENASARDIETFRADTQKPWCGHAGKELPHCSVSHDGRFAVAVSDTLPVGVDVEVVSDRAVKTARLYMSDEEQHLIDQSPLGQAEAALRVWSTKEAASKAAGMELAVAWHQVALISVDNYESRVHIKDIGVFESHHATVDDHLFTVLVMEAWTPKKA